MQHKRFGIVYRMTLIFSLLVLATAVMMYWGVELRKERVLDTQRRERLEFLVNSISLGIQNYVASGDEDLIRQVVFEALNKNVNPEIVVTGCTITNKEGKKVFEYKMPWRVKAQATENISADVVSESGETGQKTVIGAIRLTYQTRDAEESEKTRQIITIGNTIGSMFQVFYRNNMFFQAKELVETVEQDSNILYCYIIGLENEAHFTYPEGGSKLEKRVTPAQRKRALSVNHANPIVIQDIAKTARHGRVIEVSILIEEGAEKLGVVRIGYSLKEWSDKIADARRNVTLIIIGMTMLALALSFYLSRSISRPITRLKDVARSVSEEAPQRNIDLDDAEADVEKIEASFHAIADRLRSRRDEVGDLAESFSQMISSLRHRIKELKQFYQKMGQADRLFAMGQLSAGIAHEINNPLAIISTYAQIIEKRKDLDDELRKEVSIMREEIQRIAGKVGDLLSFAQESEVSLTQADLHNLIRRTLSLLNHRFKKQNIEVVERFCETDPLPVHMDENKIKQVILNLSLNALQAMEDGGRLTFSTDIAEDGQSVHFRVRDTGYGIPERDQPHIFDPFFTRRRTGQGTGLGLAISYNIVKAHGGEIDVKSSVDAGTEFIVSLPCSDESMV